MSAVPFQIAQKEIKHIANPARITGVGGDNATEFYLKFPRFPPGSQWVFPFTYGFMYLPDVPSYQGVQIDASQTPPPGTTIVAPTTKVAFLAAYDSDVTFNPGVVAPSSAASLGQGVAFPLVSRAIGTYKFVVPEQTSAKGIIVFVNLTTSGNGAEVRVFNQSVSGYSASFADTGVLSATGLSIIRIYPGLVTTAPFVVNDIISGSPIIQLDITLGNMTVGVDYVMVN